MYTHHCPESVPAVLLHKKMKPLVGVYFITSKLNITSLSLQMFLQLLKTAAESGLLEKDKGKYIFFHAVLEFVYQLTDINGRNAPK